MRWSLFGLLRPRPASARRRPAPRLARARLCLEGLEERTVLSSPAVMAPPALAPALVAAAAPAQQVTMIPFSITGVAVQNGQLIANGLVGHSPFTAPLTFTTSPSADADCPILNLHLGPIHLDLLGLTVDTSEICLAITAHPGSGNLLGNLLCGVSHLLDGGTPLGNILGGLTSTDLGTLTTGLTGLINGALAGLTSSSAVTAAQGNILHLSLGPVDLNLLGLEVRLDNCHNGPVTLDISARPGPGNLLGNLINSLTHLLDHHPGLPAVVRRLERIADLIAGLI